MSGRCLLPPPEIVHERDLSALSAASFAPNLSLCGPSGENGPPIEYRASAGNKRVGSDQLARGAQQTCAELDLSSSFNKALSWERMEAGDQLKCWQMEAKLKVWSSCSSRK